MIKNMLKGGLRSLIPNRGVKDPDDVLDDLEQELAGETPEQSAQTVDIDTGVSNLNSPASPVIEETSVLNELAEEETIKIRRPKRPAKGSLPAEETPQPAADDEEEVITMPPKPNVTPLEIDVEEEKEEEKEEPAAGNNKETAATGDMWDKHEDTVQHVPIDEISVNPNQPRHQFDPAEMDELKSSIAQHGILQPLVVRRVGDNEYELVAGERRLRAAKDLDWDKVPCVVRRGVTSGASRLQLALIENIQRKDLNPVEEALAYKQLNEEYGMTHEEIGERVGRSRVGITNIIRVLQLTEEIQKGLVDGKITSGHAKAILMIPDSEKQTRFYRHLVEEGLTVRKAESRARRIQRTMNIEDPMRHNKRQGRSAFEIKYSGLLEDRYGHHAQLRFEETLNRYEVTFKCYSKEEIDSLVGRLLGTEPLPEKGRDKDVIESGENE